MGGDIKQKLNELEQQKEALFIEAKQLEEKMVTLSTELSKIKEQISNDNSESQQDLLKSWETPTISKFGRALILENISAPLHQERSRA